MIDRICSKKYGSLSWQYRFESKKQEGSLCRIILLSKIMLLGIVASVSLTIWFIIGLFTCGILWPPSMRRFIFASTTISEKTEMEALQEDIRQILKIVRTERKDVKKEDDLDVPVSNQVPRNLDNSDLVSLETGTGSWYTGEHFDV